MITGWLLFLSVIAGVVLLVWRLGPPGAADGRVPEPTCTPESGCCGSGRAAPAARRR